MHARITPGKPRGVACSQTAGEQIRAVAQLPVLLVFVLVLLLHGFDPQIAVATAAATTVVALWSGPVTLAALARRLPVFGELGGAR
ncbi:hypothetical protein ACFORH_20360 [Amycolatopsis roodepoortensis]|uniref:Uncharacterized protein n=1 Tax=Amycolatopsis roodepoortensis TaxID=700274 RepID=A0ABR9LDS0_9PSEU|nr:hypothetical protein [Amycolatopsis roodepoortensis]MBE1578826.1 hypothetical protein [Amycolatopsis roodepoortensis]